MLSLKISVISMMKKTQTMLNTIDKQDSKQWYKYDIIINRVFNKKYDNLFVWNINYYLASNEFMSTKGWYRSDD